MSCRMCRSSANKVLPAMYIEEETELAFDDITPEDPDFAAIQGLGNRTSYMLLRSPCSNCSVP